MENLNTQQNSEKVNIAEAVDTPHKMVKNIIFVKDGDQKKEYFYHETYDSWGEALMIGKMYKMQEGSKYYILIDTWTKKEDQFHLYLDNLWNAI